MVRRRWRCDGSIDGHAGGSSEGGSEQIEPQVLRLQRDEGGREGSCGVHRCAADGASEHGFQGDHGADSYPGHDPFFFGTGGDSQDHDHQDQAEQEFEREGLAIAAGWQRGAEGFRIGEKTSQYEAGQDSTCALASDVRHDISAIEPTCEAEGDRDGRVQVATGDVPKGVDQGHDDQAEGERDSHVGDFATGGGVDHDRSSTGKKQCKGSECFGEAASNQGRGEIAHDRRQEGGRRVARSE